MAKFNPLDHPICFSYPLRLAATSELAHVSFAMSLVDLVRPRTIVELGTTEGVLYSAFCQAVRDLRLDSRCYSISNHLDGRVADPEDVAQLGNWKAAHARQYSAFSQLLGQPAAGGALDRFAGGSIDLLRLNGEDACRLAGDAESWLPKLSSKGVIVLTETNVNHGSSEIWKLWVDLKLKYPSFEFGYGGGFGIVATGTEQPDGLVNLLQAREPEISLVREFFRQQAQRLVLSSNDAALSGNGNKAATTERERELLSAGLVAKSQESDERKKALDSALTELRAMQHVLETTERNLTQTRDELDEESSELSVTKARLEAILDSRAWQWVNRYGRIKNWVMGRRPQRNLLPSDGSDLLVGIDSIIPDQIVVGKGSALYISGWCYHPEYKVKDAHLVINGHKHPMKASRMPREDVLNDQFPEPDQYGNSYRSGFWTILGLEEVEEAVEVSLMLQVTLENKTACEKQLATLTLVPARENPKRLRLPEFRPIENQPLVAICMTTYDPRIDLFIRQVESIINQTYTNWVCVISDDNSRPEILEQIKTIAGRDDRFHVFPGSGRLGFYHNFERSISLAPEAAEFLALSDQDDFWHPDKLQSLLSKFDDQTTLVYSDMNIVEDTGKQLASTYWTTRPNSYKNFASLLMANTVTGAASMFRRGLLPFILPFPEKVGNPYHDHWIACTALAMGEIKYVDRSLYDYVQHSTNALGHYAPEKRNLRQRVRGATLALIYLNNWLRVSLANWKTVYFYDLLREQLMCKVLELRCNKQLTRSKRRGLALITEVDESVLAFGWMATRGLKDGGQRRETLGAERVFLLATVWKKYAEFRQWMGDGAVERKRLMTSLPEPDSPKSTSAGVKPSPLAQTFTQVQFTEQKIAPLALKSSATATRRLNLLIPHIDLKHFFGGYITKLNLARRLAEAGFNVRIIIVDICDYLPSVWRRQLQTYEGLERLFDKVEIVYAHDRSKLLEVSADDVFMATTWWTAHIAHEAAKALHEPGFIYLIQEYEPFTFPMGTFASLAHETYSFPHYAMFSTELLRDYFRRNEIGVFSRGLASGEKDSISFQNCITSVGEMRLEDIADRTPKKLLFYARPEAHAARNMFEMATLALSGAIRAGYFQGEWEFYGIGTVGTIAKVELTDGVYMTLFPRQSQHAYREILRQHDLGLSLMYTPHPSLVPIEMAAAGMLVVTNTYANKTADELTAISSNIIAVEPTIENIKEALKEAAGNINDYERRVRGSKVNWSDRWEDSFDERVLGKIKEFVATHQHR
jgi:glycosyltransferase involved in cell wall biosynthesis